MTGAVFAILASLCIAIGSIAIKRGIQDTSLFAGLLVSLLAGSLCTLPGAVASLNTMMPVEAVLLFALAGCLGSVFGRGASIAGIDRFGASISVTLEGTLYPLIAVIGGIVYLSARLTAYNVLGIAAIITGIALLSRANPEPLDVDVGPRFQQGKRGLFPGILFPVAAGALFALADMMRDRAVESASAPLFGTFLGMASGLAICGLLLAASRKSRTIFVMGRGAWWFAVQGVANAAATVLVIMAFSHTDVSVVSPILAAQPLPVLVLSALFLQGFESVNRLTVGGSLSMVTGVILVMH